MKYSIENMVCPRCIDSVSHLLEELNISASSIDLGEFEVESKLNDAKLSELDKGLKKKGFELVFDRETEIVNSVKSALLNYLAQLEMNSASSSEKMSFYIARKTNYNYAYLSKVFSDKTGSTIEARFIELKIERVKELLSFHKWTLSEIAWKLNYSSVQYLSNQFKKITGLTVTEYIKSNKKDRKSLDQV